MKFFLFFLLLLPTVYGSETITVDLGSSLDLYILAQNKSSFKHKVVDNGSLTINPKLNLNFESRKVKDLSDYSKTTISLSNDGVGSPILGFYYSTGFTTSFVQWGLLFGGYFMDGTAWEQTPVRKFWIGSNLGLVPFIGVEVNFDIYKYKRIKITQKNNITPSMSTHMIGLTFEF